LGRASPHKNMRPEVKYFLFAICKGACFSELRERAAVLRQALCVKMLLSCQLALRSALCPSVICVGGNAGWFSVCGACAFRGLSLDQRTRSKMLPVLYNCAVAKSPPCYLQRPL